MTSLSEGGYTAEFDQSNWDNKVKLTDSKGNQVIVPLTLIHSIYRLT